VSLETEFATLLHSDLSGAAIDQLVTVTGLFVRNTLLHFFMGSTGYLLLAHGRGRLVRRLLAAYVALQVVQMGGGGRFAVVLADGIFDIAVVFAGALAALWITGREVRV